VTTTATRPNIETHPLTPDRWRHLAELFDTAAVTRQCWCMWPRTTGDYTQKGDAANRRAFKKVVDTAEAPPGVLAYVDGVVAGWCAIAPRELYPRLDGARATTRVDDDAVWSVVCFFIRRGMRGKGLAGRLLAAAVELAAQHGARMIEGYPIEGRGDPFHGVSSVFLAAGFEEVARRRDNRPVMRYRVRTRRRG
jgi:GNAT superfamily N-acetyltransferase